MARKTVIRRLAKRLPILDASVAESLQRDDDLSDYAAGNATQQDTQPAAEAVAAPVKRRPAVLAAVAATVAQADPEPPPFDADTGEVLPPAAAEVEDHF
jgi:hypothetical protein